MAEDAELRRHDHDSLATDVDGLDEDAEDVAGMGAVYVDGTCGRVDPVQVDGVQDVAGRLHLLVEAVGGLQADDGAGAYRQRRLSFAAEGEDAVVLGQREHDLAAPPRRRWSVAVDLAAPRGPRRGP